MKPTAAPRKKTKAAKSAAAKKRGKSAPMELPIDEAISILHNRWENVSDLISKVVGLEKDDPAFWEQGLYQLWLRFVVERIVFRRDDLDLDELAVISRMMLAQHKRSPEQAKQDRSAEGRPTGETPPDRLPEYFEEIVEQLYGLPEEKIEEHSDKPI